MSAMHTTASGNTCSMMPPITLAAEGSTFAENLAVYFRARDAELPTAKKIALDICQAPSRDERGKPCSSCRCLAVAIQHYHITQRPCACGQCCNFFKLPYTCRGRIPTHVAPMTMPSHLQPSVEFCHVLYLCDPSHYEPQHP